MFLTVADEMSLQDSPNERGIMGSKASGEPSLLLSVSILHAMRMAVGAARAELAASQANTLPRVITPAACTPGEVPICRMFFTLLYSEIQPLADSYMLQSPPVTFTCSTPWPAFTCPSGLLDFLAFLEFQVCSDHSVKLL